MAKKNLALTSWGFSNSTQNNQNKVKEEMIKMALDVF